MKYKMTVRRTPEMTVPQIESSGFFTTSSQGRARRLDRRTHYPSEVSSPRRIFSLTGQAWRERLAKGLGLPNGSASRAPERPSAHFPAQYRALPGGRAEPAHFRAALQTDGFGVSRGRRGVRRMSYTR